LFDEVLTPERVAEIRAYLQRQRALGSERFQPQVEAMLGRCAKVRPAHRPVPAKQGALTRFRLRYGR
jgi:putative transposase